MEDRIYAHMYRVETEHWWFVARREILLNAVATLVRAVGRFKTEFEATGEAAGARR